MLLDRATSVVICRTPCLTVWVHAAGSNPCSMHADAHSDAKCTASLWKVRHMLVLQRLPFVMRGGEWLDHVPVQVSSNTVRANHVVL